ncbi:MAG: hypothetical protein ACOYXB_11555 [Bacteroidota bacterium]
MKRKKPWQWWLLILILIVQALNAIGGGLVMVIAPDGSILQVSTEMLTGSPFSNYLIPGLILMIVLGLIPVVIMYGLISRKKFRWAEKLNLYPAMHWSWTFTLYICITILIWIFTELLMLQRFDPLMSIVGLWSVGMLILVMTPGIMKFYTEE